jgi:putative membrane protein
VPDEPRPDPATPAGGPFDPTVDATRRTHLANERTYLAWWRTGLTAFAVALGAGKLVPALTDVSRLPYTLLGAGFAVLGLLFVTYASLRHRELERAVAKGEFVAPDRRFMWILAFLGLVLGVFLLVLVLIES